ncbi:MAG: hypothetical protein VKJ05_04920 [Synechococcaceae cyanobacterium]|nr:hypothetical protein [Synechococcaceae cyanobacterium]
MDRYGGDGAFRERPADGRRPSSRELEQRLDRWVSAGRQLVDGVAGSRPGSRPPSRSAGPGRPGGLGRWLEDRIDWLLDDGDDWREPWQESAPAPPPPRRPRPEPPAASPQLSSSPRLSTSSRLTTSSQLSSPPLTSQPPLPAQPPSPPPARRRSLEAISRRGATPAAPAGAGAAAPADWPDDESFTVPRWQRPAAAAPAAADLTAPPAAVPPPAEASRPLPRSTRRRP